MSYTTIKDYSEDSIINVSSTTVSNLLKYFMDYNISRGYSGGNSVSFFIGMLFLNQIIPCYTTNAYNIGGGCNNTDYYQEYCYASTQYDALIPYEVPPCVYIPISKLNDLTTELSDYYYNVLIQEGGYPVQSDGITGSTYLTKSEFLALYGEYYVILDTRANYPRLYDNSSDGSISSSSPRTELTGKYQDIYARFSYTGIKKNGTTTNGNGDMLIGIINSLMSSTTDSYLRVGYGILPLITENASDILTFIGSSSSSYTSTRINSMGSASPKVFNIFTKTGISTLLNTLGIPFSFDLNEILYSNSEDFTDGYVIGFPGKTSNTGGGSGSFSAISDDIAFPIVPTLSAVSAGFITLFAPTITQLNSLASYMWSSSFDLDTLKKLFADPMDLIIGLSIVPVSVPVSGSATVKVGFIDTGISMYLASSQYTTIDCGTLTLSEYWGSALDYSPYTKFSIHLPYIGTRELNTDDIMGKAIQVVYNIDILSGACTAMIKCGSSVLYEFSGACATSIPVTGQNWTQLITSCIQLAGAGIAVAASGGSAAGLLPSTANAVTAMKSNIQRTGAVSGSAGMLGIQQPYLIWELPRQSLAKNYNKFAGYPSNITALLSTLTGYTQIENVHLENIPATQTELAEIETLLKEGVII